MIVGAIAPTVLAMYWLDQKQFLTATWPLIVLLSLSIGSLLILLAFVGAMLADTTLRRRVSGTKDSRDRNLVVGLVAGAVTALLMQLLAFGYVSHAGKSFQDFISISFALTLLFVVGDITSELLRFALKKVWGKDNSGKAG